MFTNLRMVNFKSWKDTGDVRLAPLTVLFGGNSAGKSGLLQMLLLLKQTTESSDRNVVLQTGIDYREKDYVRLGTPNDITHFDTSNMALSVGWNWPDSEQPLSFPRLDNPRNSKIKSLEFLTQIQVDTKYTHATSFVYRQGQGEQEKIEAYFKREPTRGYILKVRLGEDDQIAQPRFDGISSILDTGKCYSFPPAARRLFASAPYFLDDLEWKIEEQFKRTLYLGPLREFPQRIYPWAGERPSDAGHRGEHAIQALLGRGLQNCIEKSLQELDLLASFDVRAVTEGEPWYRVHVRRHGSGHEVLLPDIGFGVSQVLPVLVQCLYAPEHSTIILEHPDLHLHPSAQAGLADFLIEVMKQRNLQLIVESHSEHLLRRLQRRAAEAKLRPDEVALYFCDIQDGVSGLTKLEFDVFGQISNWPDDFFGDMTADVIASLESSLDRQLADG